MKSYSPAGVLSFWTNEIGPEAWYFGGEKIDDIIRSRFEPLWDAIMAGEHSDWGLSPPGSLARIIVLDQFSRNMFRGSSKSFSADNRALQYTRDAIRKGFDMDVLEPERQFFYLPYMHSEVLDVQDEGINLMSEKMNSSQNLLHAKAHREIIARFGRFPYRNEALGRETTEEEADWMAQGGYKCVVDALRE